MGNLAQRMRSHMSSKRKKPPTDEFTPADIQKKFDNIPVLTAMEKKVLKTSWKAIKRKMDKVGQGTFLELFSAYPDSQDVFRRFRGDDLIALEQSVELVQHGERVMAMVEVIIQSLDSYQNMWDILIQLGRQHFLYGALPMYMELMGPHFVIAVRQTIGQDWYEALEYHWLALFGIIYYCMDFGWQLQRADEQKRARLATEASKAR